MYIDIDIISFKGQDRPRTTMVPWCHPPVYVLTREPLILGRGLPLVQCSVMVNEIFGAIFL